MATKYALLVAALLPGDKICIIGGTTFTKGNIVFSTSLSVDKAVKKLDIKS